ncbi:MAG: DUF3142 domain-containing protein [Acidobacteria bacterium]|nr:DUF3142 domain-containing protein [Acidobacteriota bacterium]MDA1233995.1 DUF3142 domain-containing protein [Acidobacteriota bacterium]
MHLRLSNIGAWAAVAVMATVLSLAAWAFARSSTADADPLADLPRVLLWAWERPEDFSFLDPDDAGVVVLAGTISLHGDRVEARPRMQPVVIPARVVAFPVIRIETDRTDRPSLSATQHREVVDAILALVRGRKFRVLQIDFDAVVSERGFYRELLQDLRARLPAGTGLSMTALASWCLGDPWIADLPVDEAVPMLFEMGVDEGEVAEVLRRRGDFTAAVCRHSVGISTKEAFEWLPRGRRIFLFDYQPWSEESFAQAFAEVRKWR